MKFHRKYLLSSFFVYLTEKEWYFLTKICFLLRYELWKLSTSWHWPSTIICVDLKNAGASTATTTTNFAASNFGESRHNFDIVGESPSSCQLLFAVCRTDQSLHTGGGVSDCTPAAQRFLSNGERGRNFPTTDSAQSKLSKHDGWDFLNYRKLCLNLWIGHNFQVIQCLTHWILQRTMLSSQHPAPPTYPLSLIRRPTKIMYPRDSSIRIKPLPSILRHRPMMIISKTSPILIPLRRLITLPWRHQVKQLSTMMSQLVKFSAWLQNYIIIVASFVQKLKIIFTSNFCYS